MRSLPLRILVFGAVLVLAATGAWALPADEARLPIDTAVHAGEIDVAPDVALPHLTDDAAREVGPNSTVPITTLPAVVPADADHLATESAAPTSEPAVVASPTSAPLPTGAPVSTTPLVTVAFTATQAYGSCGEDVPFDIFSGRATPGTTVSISSPYGSARTAAGTSGHWERKVEFPSAPRGETFSVSATGLGGSTTLHFTATGNA